MTNWERIEEVYWKAADIRNKRRRDTFVKEACRNEPVAREEVDSLLSLFDRDHTAPQVIDGFRVLSVLARGGTSTVYLAEQRTPIRCPVALKLVRFEHESEHENRKTRFETERHALTLMSHPNIARLYDAGYTTAGRPYLAIEYIPLGPIHTHCDRRHLPITERLKLFLEVCNGIHHAHEKSIIHRDLKPSNILMARRDHSLSPKVIDFGMASKLDDPACAVTDIGTDIHALGVVLHQLLVGIPPSDIPVELQQARRMVPEKPSTRILMLGADLAEIAKNRRSDRQQLRQQLQGAIDAIVLKALEPQRARRYGSAAAFADDIRRYLDHKSVMA